MTYYCIYKNECSFKKCVYRKTNSKFSTGDNHRDLTINGFNCIVVGNKKMTLISDERIICNKYRECDINCFLKTNYIIIDKYFEYLSKPYRCQDTGQMVNLFPAHENVGSYTSIWNRPNLFTKKTTREE
jgi:hypothetical protein